MCRLSGVGAMKIKKSHESMYENEQRDELGGVVVLDESIHDSKTGDNRSDGDEWMLQKGRHESMMAMYMHENLAIN
jgi:hypothetical protein